MDPQTSSQGLPDIFIDEAFVDNGDILRGDRCSTAELGSTHSAPHSPEQRPAASPTSPSAASSSPLCLAGAFGNLAIHLERAITCWACTNWADSSSSMTSRTSSETPHPPFRTRNKSKRSPCKRPPPSLADAIQREQSERAVAARLRCDPLRAQLLFSPPVRFRPRRRRTAVGVRVLAGDDAPAAGAYVPQTGKTPSP
jgi:hypothetical protein